MLVCHCVDTTNLSPEKKSFQRIFSFNAKIVMCFQARCIYIIFKLTRVGIEKDGTVLTKSAVLGRKVCCVGGCAKMTHHDRDIRDSLFTHHTA